jgi:hypothetical protein
MKRRRKLQAVAINPLIVGLSLMALSGRAGAQALCLNPAPTSENDPRRKLGTFAIASLISGSFGKVSGALLS